MKLITVGNSLVEEHRIEECVDALAGISDPVAWVDAAKRLGESAWRRDHTAILAACLDMRAAKGEE